MPKAKKTSSTNDGETKQNWMTMKPAEIEKIVLELHKQGESPAKIGLILRDKYGIPKAKLLGKRVTQIIKDAKGTVVTEKEKVAEKIKNLESHRAKHKHDYSALRSLSKKMWIVGKSS